MNRRSRIFLTYLIPILIIALAYGFLGKNIGSTEEFSINKVIHLIDNNGVEEMTMQGQEVFGMTKDEKPFKSFIPDSMIDSFYDDYLKERVENNHIIFTGAPIPETPWYIELLPMILIGFLFFIFIFMFFGQMQAGGGSGGRMMDFGKSRAELVEDQDLPKVRFKDVAGLVEEKEELMEVVDFLKDPKKYTQMGARIPKGVLMVGGPGTGKTYLSKAVAGEAKVPFFTISGSDFVEMFVGIGASRVRDLFEKAKKNAPCIIFIDEIDAVGRKRGAGLGGGHDEREQTLNQLLVEMDGFKENEGVIIMAATNRPDILDPALLRPGRFDRQIHIDLPDVKAREEILKVHTKNKTLDPSVDLETIARRTAGFSPADLENVSNEAAILTAREDKKAITPAIFEEAVIKVVAGPEKKSQKVIEKERVLTAYHEAGHAIVSKFLPEMDTVHMITIVPRGRAGGFTSYIPKEEKMYHTKKGMEQMLVALLGGRAAEEIVLDDISTGASNDIQRATHIARSMVTKYGFSEKLGPLSYDSGHDQVFLGDELVSRESFSEKTIELIDDEVTNFVEKAHQRALKLLEENIDLLHALAKKLLEDETIHRGEFEELFEKYTKDHEIEDPPKELEEAKKLDEEAKRILDEGEEE